MKKVALIAAMAASLVGAGAALAQPYVDLQFGHEAPGSFWYHAPSDIHERFAFLENRMDRMRADGRISPGDWDIFHNQLANTKATYENMRLEDHGQLSDRHRLMIWHKLQEVSNHINWRADYGY